MSSNFREKIFTTPRSQRQKKKSSVCCCGTIFPFTLCIWNWMEKFLKLVIVRSIFSMQFPFALIEPRAAGKSARNFMQLPWCLRQRSFLFFHIPWSMSDLPFCKNAFYTNKWPFSKMWICARWPSYLGQHKQKQTSSCDLEVLDPLQLRCLYSAARVARALENSSLMVSKWKIM